MQTLLDPFEAAPVPVALPESRRFPAPFAPLAPSPATPQRRVSSIEIELNVEDVEDRPAPRQPGADSSGRLRYWCSEDD